MFGKKNAFTLAEVLVTLGIIGVVAAMTVPGLKKNADQREMVTGCQKALSTISSAVSMVENEFGPTKVWNWNDSEEIAEEFAKNFNTTEWCKDQTKCIKSYNVYQMDGNVSSYGNTNTFGYKMADGSFIVFYTCIGDKKGPCGTTTYKHDPKDTVQASFFVDVNGLKEPNTFGYDIFLFNIIKDKGVLPAGSYDYSDCKTGQGRGLSCTARIIKEGKITW